MKEPDAARDDAIRRSSEALAGEGLEYFTDYKLRVVRRILGREFTAPLLDYGCQAGDLLRLLTQCYDSVHGYDPSPVNIELATKRAPRAQLFDDPALLPKGHFGAVILAGVLRYLPPENRPGMMRNVVQLLARGGKVIVFEHNALNPVMRRVVRGAERDGVEVPSPREVKRLLKDAKLARVSRDYIVFFPRAASMLRPLEPWMARLPLGAQIVAWGEKR